MAKHRRRKIDLDSNKKPKRLVISFLIGIIIVIIIILYNYSYTH